MVQSNTSKGLSTLCLRRNRTTNCQKFIGVYLSGRGTFSFKGKKKENGIFLTKGQSPPHLCPHIHQFPQSHKWLQKTNFPMVLSLHILSIFLILLLHEDRPPYACWPPAPGVIISVVQMCSEPHSLTSLHGGAWAKTCLPISHWMGLPFLWWLRVDLQSF